MKFFADERPTINDVLHYVRPDGRKIAALPQLEVEPCEDGSWEVEAWLITAANTATRFTARPKNMAELVGLLELWREDPERVMREHMKYPFPEYQALVAMQRKPTAQSSGPAISLDDLDL